MLAALMGSVVPGSLSCGLVGSAVKAIPGVGALAGAPTMALFSGGATWALGKVFIQHFEAGGTFLDFDPEKVKDYFKAQFEEGRKQGEKLPVEETAAV